MNPNAILSKFLPFDFYFDLLTLIQNGSYADLDREFVAFFKSTSKKFSRMLTVISLNGNGENNQEELRRRKYLIFRGSVFCLGLSKFIEATICCILYLLTLSVKPRPHTEHLLPTLQIGLLVATGPLIVYGTILIISTLRAMTFHQFTLLLAIIFAIVLGIYNFLLGFLGAYTYFSSMAYTKQFLMVVAFTCQATNIICSFIYDLPLLIAFRRIRKQDIQNRAYN